MTDARLSISRWWLVAVGALAMGIAGTFQFVWSSIRGPLGAQIGASEATLGTLFTLLIAAQTLSQFPAGWFRDRYGPRLPMAGGAVLIAGGYAGLAVAPTPALAALASLAGGVGSGMTYTVAVNTPVKWFEERRGLATGVVTMAYSALSVVLIPVVRGGVAGTFGTTLLLFAVVGGLVCLLGAVLLRDPETQSEASGDADAGDGTADGDATAGDVHEGETTVHEPSYTWRETVRTWQFWVLYGAFVVVNGVGLMLIGTAIAFADALGLSAAVATTAASVIAIADGTGAGVVGGLSDRLGRVRTVGTALVVSALGIVGAVPAAERRLAVPFVVLVGVAAFFRSPVFAIFPSLVGEYYGTAHSSENYAVLYTGKLWGSVFGGVVTSALVAALGWTATFLLGAGLLALTGLATLSVRPVETDDG